MLNPHCELRGKNHSSAKELVPVKALNQLGLIDAPDKINGVPELREGRKAFVSAAWIHRNTDTDHRHLPHKKIVRSKDPPLSFGLSI
jgi:hypothetical protein